MLLSRGLGSVSAYFSVSICLAASLLTTACGETPSIELRNPVAPSPTDIPQKPTGPGGQKPSGEDGGTGTGSVPGSTPAPNPGPAPLPPVTPPNGHRLVCVTAASDRSLVALSSLAGPTEPGIPITTVEPEADDDQITRADSNLADSSLPVAVRGEEGTLQLLVKARRASGTNTSSFKIYSIASDLTMSLGVATPIASAVSVSSDAQSLAGATRLRNYGASNLGSFVFVPGASGTLRVLNANSLKDAGQIALDPRTNFFPQFDEVSGVFSVLSYRSGSLLPTFYSVKVSGQGNSKRLVFGDRISVQTGSGIANAPTLANGHWVWGETSGDYKRITLARWSPDTGRIERYAYSESGARIAPFAVPVVIDGEEHFAIVVEKIVPTGARVPYKVETAKIVLLRETDGKTLSAREVNYPIEVVRYLTGNGLNSKMFAGSSLIGASDAQAFFITLPTKLGPSVYTLRQGELEQVTFEICDQTEVLSGSK